MITIHPCQVKNRKSEQKSLHFLNLGCPLPESLDCWLAQLDVREWQLPPRSSETTGHFPSRLSARREKQKRRQSGLNALKTHYHFSKNTTCTAFLVPPQTVQPERNWCQSTKPGEAYSVYLPWLILSSPCHMYLWYGSCFCDKSRYS